jgi:hypothetical protein
MGMKRLNTRERKILDRVYGRVVEQEWVEHVVGMDRGRLVKKIFESKLQGRRGRPRLMLLEEVAKDLREMKVKSWRNGHL